MRYFYAAYKMGGSTPEMDFFPMGLKPEEFELLATDHLGVFDRVFTVEGSRPLGLIAKRGWEIHALWFGWSTARERLEGAARFLHDFRKENWGIVMVPKDRLSFFNSLADYGLLVRVGTFAHHPDRLAVYEVNHVVR